MSIISTYYKLTSPILRLLVFFKFINGRFLNNCHVIKGLVMTKK